MWEIPHSIVRSYWISGAYAPALSEKQNACLRLWKNKGFKEENVTKFGVDAIGMSTTLESNKSLIANERGALLTLLANELTMIDKSLQTSIRAQINCQCVKYTHQAG
jgi:hypothetical protein